MTGGSSMRKLWILVANSCYGQIFEVSGPARNMREVQYLDFPDGRKKASQVYSNRPDRTFDRMGNGRHAVVNEVDYHDHVQHIFAKQLAGELKKGMEAKSFDEIALIAPADFLGVLNNELPEKVKKMVTNKISKDLPSTKNPQERMETVIKLLDLP